MPSAGLGSSVHFPAEITTSNHPLGLHLYHTPSQHFPSLPKHFATFSACTLHTGLFVHHNLVRSYDASPSTALNRGLEIPLEE